MDEDEDWLRQPWEDTDPPPRQTSGRPATGTEALLIPLARAQDAVARLEASVAAAPELHTWDGGRQGACKADPCHDRRLDREAAHADRAGAGAPCPPDGGPVQKPWTAAAEQKLRADRIKRLAQTLAVIAVRTNDEAFTNLFALDQDAATKRDAARLAAEGLFGGDSLPDVGGEVWRTLWDAARRYSTQVAYPDAPFPPTQPDTLCVLCHQPLSAEAIQRMRRFETFIRDDTERKAQEAEDKLSAAVRALEGLAIRLEPVADSLREVELHDKALAKTTRRGLASARLRGHAAMRRVAGDDAAIVPAAAPFRVTPLTTLESDIREYAADLQKAAIGDERKRLEAERQELADRATLNAHMDIVKAEIGRLQAIRFLEACIGDTATNAITTLGNKIADQVLTPRLRDRFAAELIELVGVNVRVEMVRAGGQYGSPQYQVRLLARPDAKVAEVLSEGEQTCVAVAAFLAELATAPHTSALVFDDPITSLDHKWRHKVAKRLVAEAAVRQVIVFTHDLIFLNDIQDAAKRTTCETRHIRRSATTVGMVNTDLPWDGMKVAARVDARKSGRGPCFRCGRVRTRRPTSGRPATSTMTCAPRGSERWRRWHSHMLSCGTGITSTRRS